MPCPNCGGALVGDGYTVTVHCERVTLTSSEPDASPVYCTPCTDYRPDHNGECMNCDEPADAHLTDTRLPD